jgi:N-acylneuraminate cytidylyltransferase
MGCTDKLEAVRKICKDMGIGLDEVAYMGDDINDLEHLWVVAVSASYNEAVRAVKNVVIYQCENNDGQGAVREFIDFLLLDM